MPETADNTPYTTLFSMPSLQSGTAYMAESLSACEIPREKKGF
ncbi:MAG TPA: hypothetical protein ACFYEJ_10155 [Candidatus Wujingus californicus]